MSRRALQLLCLMLGLSHVACMSFHRGALPGEPKDASFHQLEQARVRYLDEGEGPPVVLIHGFAASMDTWKPVLPALVENHRVIALDLKGFGWTDRPPGDYSPKAQAALVFALLDRLGMEKAAVVAHSWGSSVALRMALDQPQRVTKIALYDAWVYEEQLPSTFLWARAGGLGEVLFGLFYKERPGDKMALAFHDPKYVTHDFVEEVAATLDRPGTVAPALEAVRGQRYAENEDRYSEIRQETLLLWGREDRVTTLAIGERLSQQLPHARLVVYPRCGPPCTTPPATPSSGGASAGPTPSSSGAGWWPRRRRATR